MLVNNQHQCDDHNCFYMRSVLWLFGECMSCSVHNCKWWEDPFFSPSYSTCLLIYIISLSCWLNNSMIFALITLCRLHVYETCLQPKAHQSNQALNRPRHWCLMQPTQCNGTISFASKTLKAPCLTGWWCLHVLCFKTVHKLLLYSNVWRKKKQKKNDNNKQENHACDTKKRGVILGR